MDAFRLYEQKREAKQLLGSIVFIFILLAGWYVPLLGYFIPLCMLSGIGIGLFRGRKWCDWYCPRGSFYDALAGKLSPQRKIPAALRNMYLRIGVLFLLMLIMGFNLFKRWPNPTMIGMFFVIMLSITTVIGVILAIVFHQRSWCLICPIGTAINLIGRNKYPVEIDSSLCVECKLCAKVCPVQIKPYTFKSKGRQAVRDGDCLRCGLCIAVCPKKALRFKKE